jgi:hypothetical protein
MSGGCIILSWIAQAHDQECLFHAWAFSKNTTPQPIGQIVV